MSQTQALKRLRRAHWIGLEKLLKEALGLALLIAAPRTVGSALGRCRDRLLCVAAGLAAGAAPLFVALGGERYDGHDHVDDACARGAAMIMIDRPIRVAAPPSGGVIVVGNTRSALLDLASAYRGTIGATVIAITGSAGKTSTVVSVQASWIADTHRAKCPAPSCTRNSSVCSAYRPSASSTNTA